MELDVALRKGFRLGEWVVKPIEGLLEGAQGPRHLQPKTMDVLVCLAAQPGQVVTRDEIIERVWGGAAVSDEPLTRCIHEIRRALGDARGEPGTIKTIPKRGYQLLADVVVVPQTSAEPTISSASGNESLFWQVTRQRVLWVGAAYAVLAWVFVQLARMAELRMRGEQSVPDWLMPALVVLLLLGFPIAVFYAWVKQIKFDKVGRARPPEAEFPGVAPLFWTRRGIDTVLVTMVISFLAAFALDLAPGGFIGRSAPDLRIAVMPFDSSSDHGSENWLGKGVAEDLRLRLTNLGSIAVSSRSRSFDESIQALDAQQLGQELGVQYLLKGVVVRGADNIVVNARLIDAVTGFEVWSRSFNKKAEMLFDVQQELVANVAMSLGIDSVEQQSEAGWPQILNIAAYDSYLRGRNRLRAVDDAESAGMAAAWFEQALLIDPHLSLARVGLCQAYVLELELSGSDHAYGQANQSCAESILESPNLAEAHLALADFYRVSERYEQAVSEYEWVLDERADHAGAWLGLAKAHWHEADLRAAEAAFRQTLQLRPDDADGHEAYLAFLIGTGRYEEAVTLARALLQLDRNRIAAYGYLAESLFMTGDFEGAIQASRQVLSRDINHRQAVMTIARSYYYLGRYERAGSIYRQAAKLMPDDHFAEGGLASSYAQIDNTQSAQLAATAFKRAQVLAEKQLQARPADALTRMNLAYYCAAIGDTGCADHHRALAVQNEPRNLEVQYLEALVYALLGDSRRASAATEKALDLGFPQVLLVTDPRLADVWPQQRFATAQLSQMLLPAGREALDQL